MILQKNSTKGEMGMTKIVAAELRRAGRALIEIAEAEGVTITYENVYPGSIYTEKIIKAYHNVKYSDDIPKVKRPSILECYANADDIALKTAKVTTLEGMARELAKYSEHIDRESLRTQPPVNDRAYVERSEFTITDLYNDLMSIIEWSLFRYMALIYTFGFEALPYYSTVLDYSYYVQQRKKFRRCKYMFCLNMFAMEGDNFRNAKPKRVDSRFCCDVCRKASYDATKRFKSTGSYLPVEYYAPIYGESVDDRYRLHEQVYLENDIETEIAKKKPAFKAKSKKVSYEHGKVVTYSSLDEAEKALENAEKVDIISVYRQIIRRTNPYISRGR